MEKIICYSLGTTSEDIYKSGIHQISGIKILDGEFISEFNIKMRPKNGVLYDDKYMESQGLSREDVWRFQEREDAFQELKFELNEFVDYNTVGDKAFLMGYQIRSSSSKLSQLFWDNKSSYFHGYFWKQYLDVETLASHILRAERGRIEENPSESYNLYTVAKYLGVKLDADRLADAQYRLFATWLLYRKITFNK